jgi:hypothetical protein
MYGCKFPVKNKIPGQGHSIIHISETNDNFQQMTATRKNEYVAESVSGILMASVLC